MGNERTPGMIKSDRFEAAFSTFLDSAHCDAAEATIFTALRYAFLSGWIAAGGEQRSNDGQ